MWGIFLRECFEIFIDQCKDEKCCREAVKQKNSLAMNVTVNLPSVNGYVRFVLSDHVEKD